MKISMICFLLLFSLDVLGNVPYKPHDKIPLMEEACSLTGSYVVEKEKDCFCANRTIFVYQNQFYCGLKTCPSDKPIQLVNGTCESCRMCQHLSALNCAVCPNWYIKEGQCVQKEDEPCYMR